FTPKPPQTGAVVQESGTAMFAHLNASTRPLAQPPTIVRQPQRASEYSGGGNFSAPQPTSTRPSLHLQGLNDALACVCWTFDVATALVPRPQAGLRSWKSS
ncbi:hypothetical protein PSHT_03499, partial [Puccinia striiformis]